MNRTRIKICGVTTVEVIDAAIDAGVDALGFVFAESPRAVTAGEAAKLAESVPPYVSRVAVFFQPRREDVQRTLAVFPADVVQAEPVGGLDSSIQLMPVVHDGPDAVELIEGDVDPGGSLLFEASGRGGQGRMPSWGRAARIAARRRLVLAGGLTPENVGEAIRTVRPFAVDVSSGVESSLGVKDADLIHEFVGAVHRADLFAHHATFREPL